MLRYEDATDPLQPGDAMTTARQSAAPAIAAADQADDERTLMAEVAAGDRQAFSRLMDLHMTAVFRFSYSILGDRARAEDVTQETMLKLWRNAVSWQPTGKLRSWLLRIAHNLSIDMVRARRPTTAIETIENTKASDARDPAANLRDADLSRVVKEAMFNLPERQRTALMLVHYSECSNIEAAKIMDVSIDALESLLSRGRRQMRTLLADARQSLLEE